MIQKCKHCDGAVIYNPGVRKMECICCGSFFEVEELSSVNINDSQESYSQVEEKSYSDNINIKDSYSYSQDDTVMECNIYTCTTCSAQLAINGVESSTYCAYCGQPTIVFDRVSLEKKPKYIIPFQFDKEQAIGAIRERLNKGFFIPKKVKNFEVERVRGIYVPFWKFDLNYHDKQFFRGTVGSGKHKKTRYFYREAEADFVGITADASRQLSDESSQRLEPFDISRLKPFDIGYMAGYYADTFDVKQDELEEVAIARSKVMYECEVKKTIRASNISALTSDAEVMINQADYIMLPVWFMTFRYKNEPYTILVNGQTGKIIGGVPYFKRKVIAFIGLFGAALSAIFTPVYFLLMNLYDMEDKVFGLIEIACFASLIFIIVAIANFCSTNKSIKLTKAKTMNDFVRNRQEV